MDAIDFAFQYLLNNSLLLVGGSNSYINLKRIKKLDEAMEKLAKNGQEVTC